MKTDRLVDELVADLRPVRSRSFTKDLLLLAGIIVVEFCVFLLLAPNHGHEAGAMDSMPSFLWKLVSLAVLATASIAVALRSLDPTRSTSRGLAVIAVLVALTLLAGWAVDAMTVRPQETVWQRLQIADGVECLLSILALSIPPIVALGWLMRRAAPTNLRGTALAIGIASASVGAFLFVFACPHSDPFYVMIWFMLSGAIVAGLGRLVLPLINRW